MLYHTRSSSPTMVRRDGRRWRLSRDRPTPARVPAPPSQAGRAPPRQRVARHRLRDGPRCSRCSTTSTRISGRTSKGCTRATMSRSFQILYKSKKNRDGLGPDPSARVRSAGEAREENAGDAHSKRRARRCRACPRQGAANCARSAAARGRRGGRVRVLVVSHAAVWKLVQFAAFAFGFTRRELARAALAPSPALGARPLCPLAHPPPHSDGSAAGGYHRKRARHPTEARSREDAGDERERPRLRKRCRQGLRLR